MVSVLSVLVLALSALFWVPAAEDEQPGSPQPGARDEMRARVDSLKALADQDSTDFDLRFELANCYYDLGALPSAVIHYRKAVELDPTSLKAWVNLGVAQNEMGLSEDAIESYDKALAIDPTDNKALCNKGLAYYGLGKYYEAVNLYRKALELYPHSVEAHYNLGVAFADAQMYREAINEWTEVLKVAPGTEAAEAASANIDVIREMIRLQGRPSP
jgi:superkiller protein 3